MDYQIECPFCAEVVIVNDENYCYEGWSFRSRCPSCSVMLECHTYPTGKVKHVEIMDWRHKANRLIRNLCFQEFYRVNRKKDGTLYKKHRPYTTPELAEKLVKCLGDPDEKRGEMEAKRLFLSHDGLEALKYKREES